MIAKVLFIIFGILLGLDMLVLRLSTEIVDEEKKNDLMRTGWLGFALSLVFLTSGLMLC